MESFVNRCTEAWIEGDVNAITHLYDCEQVTLFDKTGRNNIGKKDIGEQKSIADLIGGYFDQGAGIKVESYAFPFISGDFIIDAWVMVESGGNNKKNLLMNGVDYIHIANNKIVNCVTYHLPLDEAVLAKVKASTVLENNHADYVVKCINNEKYIGSQVPLEHLQIYADKVIGLIEGEKLYLDSKVSLTSVAERLNISRAYVSQSLSVVVKKRFNVLINEYRIKDAIELMLKADKVNTNSVVDIAMAVGYNSVSCFYRAFKAYTGSTPASYYTNFLSAYKA